MQKVQRTQSPKVVSIPVRFVESERSRSESAVKIQKVFRGFLVRKSVKKIAAIRREVEEIEKKVSKKETVELIQKDSKERLRVNETLMSLLFRLDSVRGVDSGVRGCRKAVIKKAIALQEIFDAIAAGSETAGAGMVEASSGVAVVDQIIEDKEEAELPTIDGPVDSTQTLLAQGNNPAMEHSASNIVSGNDSSSEFGVDEKVQFQNHIGSTLDCEELKGTPEALDNADKSPEANHSVDSSCENLINDMENGKDFSGTYDATESVEENLGSSEGESQLYSSSNSHNLVEEVEGKMGIHGEEGLAIVCPEKKEENVMSDCGADEGNAGNTNLLERMMKDNEKMMSLMTELFERNAMQTWLISSLSQRVEQLEKAFLCDKLRRKKKRQAACTVDAPHKFPDSKKSGKNR